MKLALPKLLPDIPASGLSTSDSGISTSCLFLKHCPGLRNSQFDLNAVSNNWANCSKSDGYRQPVRQMVYRYEAIIYANLTCNHSVVISKCWLDIRISRQAKQDYQKTRSRKIEGSQDPSSFPVVEIFSEAQVAELHIQPSYPLFFEKIFLGGSARRQYRGWIVVVHLN
jgi:hypothetical protein